MVRICHDLLADAPPAAPTARMAHPTRTLRTSNMHTIHMKALGTAACRVAAWAESAAIMSVRPPVRPAPPPVRAPPD